VSGGGDYVDLLVGEFSDYLPHADMVRQLSPDEVESYVALGQAGRDRIRAGDRAGAEAAFRGQIAIYPVNDEPFVALALLHAAHGDRKMAIYHLRAAVVRGFRDLRRVERSEAWTKMPRNTEYLKLRDAVKHMHDLERDWPRWDSFRIVQVPADLESILHEQVALTARIDGMAPALGPRLTGLWHRVMARATAARLEAYLFKHPEAPDFAPAVERLMDLYTGGLLHCWHRPTHASARALARISDLVLERFPDSAMRPAALVGGALAANARRDGRGGLGDEAARQIRTALEEVVTRHADSPVFPAALVGLVRVEMETGRTESAVAHYRSFRREHAADSERVDRVQAGLGELGLRLGGLPEFRATTLGGWEFGPDTLRGKTVVLDFWATWCGPCVEEFPTLRRIGKRHGDEVLVLGINLDTAQDLSEEALREWIVREQVPGRHVHDGLSWDSDLVAAFGVSEIPFNVVVGPDGAVLAVNERGRRLEKVVRAAVERGAASP